jgi:hypothetical protein
MLSTKEESKISLFFSNFYINIHYPTIINLSLLNYLPFIKRYFYHFIIVFIYSLYNFLMLIRKLYTLFFMLFDIYLSFHLIHISSIIIENKYFIFQFNI